MAMQYDVKSKHLSAAGSVYADRTRLKGFAVAPAVSTAATFEFRDGGATGEILCQIDIPTNSNPNSFYVAIPHEGILFRTNMYLTLSVGSVLGITAFYG
jgi:hypothetical protein